MEMKKQVLSFNEFVNESYNAIRKITEGDESGATDLITAIAKLEESGLSGPEKGKIELLSTLSSIAQTQNNPDAEKLLGSSLLSFINSLSNNYLEISKVISKTNIIKYPYLVNGNVIVSTGEDTAENFNLIDYLYAINLSNCDNKNTGTTNGVDWKKLQTDKRFSASNISGKGIGKVGNFIKSFFQRDQYKNEVDDSSKNTKYLDGSGLLGQQVIFGIDSNNIKTFQAIEVKRDMLLGGSDRKKGGKDDRKGISNQPGNKSVLKEINYETPLGAVIQKYQGDPTIGKDSLSKSPKAYFTLVLYNIGKSTKNAKGIKYTEMALTPKLVPKGIVKTYTETIFNNTDNGNGNDYVLFEQNKSDLLATGKENIKALIQSFYSIESIEIQGSASDEGTQKINEDLCKARAKSVQTFINGTECKVFNIPAAKVTVSEKLDIQAPVSTTLDAVAKEKLRKPHRKVTFIIKGTKTNEAPDMELVNEYSPTIGLFYPETVEIYQTVLTLEVQKRKGPIRS
jgi:outer membrane protein OmpA-like peptidoglycan-associated protein